MKIKILKHKVFDAFVYGHRFVEKAKLPNKINLNKVGRMRDIEPGGKYFEILREVGVNTDDYEEVELEISSVKISAKYSDMNIIKKCIFVLNTALLNLLLLIVLDKNLRNIMNRRWDIIFAKKEVN